MNLRKIIFTLLSMSWVVFIAVSCVGTPKEKKLAESDSTNTTNKQKEIIVVYESCAVYAGSTKYYFKPEKGDLIEVSVLHEEMEDENEFRIKVPDNLVDDDKNIEGPPGENPKMVGKKFKLIYNENDEIIEVKPYK